MKCPKCGSLNISLDGENYKCNNCGNLIAGSNVAKTNSILDSLNDYQKSQDVFNKTMNNNVLGPLITYKCPKCLNSIVKDTSTTSPVCPWCHNTLTINDKAIDGVNPSYILPFSLDKESAKDKIEEYIKDKKMFSDKAFSNIDSNNISLVYFPYLVSDIKCHADYAGNGEISVNSEVKNGKKVYTADLYNVERNFDIDIKGLILSSNSVLNSIGPFDTSKLLPWKPGYLTGYVGVRNDLKETDFKDDILKYSTSIATNSSYDTVNSMYDRGVNWDKKDVKLVSSLSNVCYLPVYLYSVRIGKQISYVVVNGVNGNTSGDVSLSISKIAILSIVLLVLCLVLRLISSFISGLVLVGGIAFIFYIIYKYKGSEFNNKCTDTSHVVSNLVQNDKLVRRETDLTDDKIVNNSSIDVSDIKDKINGVLKKRK